MTDGGAEFMFPVHCEFKKSVLKQRTYYMDDVISCFETAVISCFLPSSTWLSEARCINPQSGRQDRISFLLRPWKHQVFLVSYKNTWKHLWMMHQQTCYIRIKWHRPHRMTSSEQLEDEETGSLKITKYDKLVLQNTWGSQTHREPKEQGCIF